MNVWLKSIIDGFSVYAILAPVLFLPLGIVSMVHNKKINFVRSVLEQLFFLYLVCVFSLVFFPLPTIEEAANLTYHIQTIPCAFVINFIKDPSVSAIAGVIFNIVMTIPFGMFLRYYLGLSERKILFLGLALTCFIEIGQLSGLFFIYHGSYRLCDIDDIIQNTMGCWFGFYLVSLAESYIPSLSAFDLTFTGEPKNSFQVSSRMK